MGDARYYDGLLKRPRAVSTEIHDHVPPADVRVSVPFDCDDWTFRCCREVGEVRVWLSYRQKLQPQDELALNLTTAVMGIAEGARHEKWAFWCCPLCGKRHLVWATRVDFGDGL